MMKITLGELKNTEKSIVYLSELNFDSDISYLIEDVVGIAAKELTKINNFINKLIIKFGEDTIIRGKPEKEIKPESPNFEIYLKNVDKLLKLEVDLPIKLLDKAIFKGIPISAQHLKRLEKFFTDYVEKKPLELVEEYDIEIIEK